MNNYPSIYLLKSIYQLLRKKGNNMDGEVSFSDFSNTATGVSGDTVLTKKVDELSKVVSGLIDTNKKQEQKIIYLEKKQVEINDRLRAQEGYTSKDCVIICNPPFDSRDSRNVLRNTLKFFENFLSIKLDENRIKACHILPGTAANGCPESVICKFVYFDEKDRVFGAKRKLKKIKSPLNNHNIYINERLPKYEAEINSEAKKMGMITSTKNCTVSVMVKNLQNETSFRAVNNVDELNKIQNPVLRESGRNKRKFMKEAEELSCEKGQERFSPDNRRPMKK